jgi:hypothetical protein
MNGFKMTILAAVRNRNRLNAMFLILLMPLLAPKNVQGELLLDHGVISPPTEGFVISGSNQSSGGFTFFQPFAISEPGWDIDTIGVHGREAFFSNGSGFIGTLVPDLNGRPDEGNLITSVSYSLPDYANPDWIYRPFDTKLIPGRYWFIASPGSPDSCDSVTQGMTGEGLFGRRGSDGLEFSHGPSAFRITGQVVPEPSTISIAIVGLIIACVVQDRSTMCVTRHGNN